MDQNFHVYIHSKSKNDPPFMFLLYKEAKIDLLIIAYPPQAFCNKMGIQKNSLPPSMSGHYKYPLLLISLEIVLKY